MRRGFLALSCLALLLLGALVLGAGLGLADEEAMVAKSRPTATPDRVFSGVDAASPDRPSLPDLVVEKIEVRPANPLINEIVMIEVTIKNQGLAGVDLGPPANNFFTDLYVDPGVVPIRLRQNGVVDWECQAWWLPRDGTWTLRTAYVFTDVKAYALYAQVDTDDSVFEEVENNNILGSVRIEVGAPQSIVQQSHEDFQMGMASNFDLSHPEGVIRRGIFEQPSSEPEIYMPDARINDVTETVTATAWYNELWTSVEQVNPTLTGDGSGALFAAWEDGRYGGVHNRRIMFSRSPDGGVNWLSDTLVTTESLSVTVDQVSPDLAYDARIGRLYAVWQDNSSGDYDIYGAYSDNGGDTWSTKELISVLTGTNTAPNDQMNPTVVVEPASDLWPLPGWVYVVWQDQRNDNDDVYIARSENGGISWGPNYFVTDDPDWSSANQKAPSVAVNESGLVFVVWEDWRYDDRPEVYAVVSKDSGETFGVDLPVGAVSTETAAFQLEPTIAVGTYVSGTRPFDEDDIAISDIHVAWQEGLGDQADIYWTVANLNLNPTTDTFEAECPWPNDFCFGSAEKVNGFVVDSDYVRPDDPGSVWPMEPSWQGQVSMDLASEGDTTYCLPGVTEPYTRGIYMVWADASSYDGWRIELQTRRIASPEGVEEYVLCTDHSTGVLNDNAKLYPFRNDPNKEGLYEIFRPAATGQGNPVIWVDPDSWPRMHVAWDDDRWNNPAVKGALQNRDIYFARQGVTEEAVYISQVFDAGAPAKWYVLSWWAATEHLDDLLFQTRFGNDPFPPQDAITTTSWTNWTGNAGSTYLDPDCPNGHGAGCYYDAPGRHIVDPWGKGWVACTPPDCPDSYQYIQYKIILTSTNPPLLGHAFKTAVSQVKIHYRGAYNIYLPAIVKGF